MFSSDEERKAFAEKVKSELAKFKTPVVLPKVTKVPSEGLEYIPDTEIILPDTIPLKTSNLTYTVIKNRRPRDDAKMFDFSQHGLFPVMRPVSPTFHRTPRTSSDVQPVQGENEDDD